MKIARRLTIKLEQNAKFDIKAIIEKFRGLVVEQESRIQINFIQHFKNLAIEVNNRSINASKSRIFSEFEVIRLYLKRRRDLKILLAKNLARTGYIQTQLIFTKLKDYSRSRREQSVNTLTAKLLVIANRNRTERLNSGFSKIKVASQKLLLEDRTRVHALAHRLSELFARRDILSKSYSFNQLKDISAIND